MLDPLHVILYNDSHPEYSLIHILRSTGICVLYQTPDLLYRWSENLPPFLRARWKIEKTDEELFPPRSAEEMQRIKNLLLRNFLKEGIPHSCLEIRLGEGDESPWFRFSISCHRDKSGKIIGLITTGIDISEIKYREQVLLRETNHRSKNLLAILQSVATLTSRHTNTTREFLKILRGRIQCLSISQDLITDSNWKGTFFHDLVRAQVYSYFEHNEICFSLSGENPCLLPSSTLHIGLALHELLTSSFIHGAFLKKAGKVEIHCRVTTVEKKDNNNVAYVSDVPFGLYLLIEWLETFPIITSEQQQKAQFCNILLERVVPAAVNGKASYEVGRSIIRYSLCYPYNIIKS